MFSSYDKAITEKSGKSNKDEPDFDFSEAITWKSTLPTNQHKKTLKLVRTLFFEHTSEYIEEFEDGHKINAPKTKEELDGLSEYKRI